MARREAGPAAAPWLNELLREQMAGARALAAAQAVTVALLREAAPGEESHLEVAASDGWEVPGTGAGYYPLPLEGSASGRAVRERRSQVLAEGGQSERCAELDGQKPGRDLHSVVAIPLLADDRCLGVLLAHYRRPGGATPERVRLLEAYATSVATAIANAQLVEQERRREAETLLLAEASRLFNSSLEPSRVFRQVAGRMRELLDADWVVLWLLPAGGEQLVRAESVYRTASLKRRVALPPRLAVRGSLAGLAVRTRRLQVTPDYGADGRVSEEYQRRWPGRAILAVPLLSRGRAMGALSIGRLAGRPYSEQEMRLAQALADRAAPALENSRLSQEARTAETYQLAMRGIGMALRATSDVDEVLAKIAEHARLVSGGALARVATLEGDELRGRVTAGDDRGYAASLRISLDPRSAYGNAPASQALRTREPVVVDDVQTDPGLIPWRRAALSSGIRSSVAVPVLAGLEALGVLSVYSPTRRAFGAAEVRCLRDLAAQAAGPLRSARLLEQEQALHEIGNEVARGRHLDQVLGTVCRGACRLLGADASHVALVMTEGTAHSAQGPVDSGRGDVVWGASGPQVNEGAKPPYLRFCHAEGISPEAFLGADVPIEGSLGGLVVQRRETVTLEDITEASEIPVHHRQALMDQGLVRIAAAPMLAGEECVGVLYTEHRARVAFSPDYLRLLRAVAVQAGIAVHNARLYATAQRQGERLLALHQLSLTVARETALEPALRAVLDSAVRLVGGDGAEVYLWQRESGELECVAENRLPISRGLRRPSDEGVTGAAFTRGEIVMANGYPDHPLATDRAKRSGVLSAAAIPLNYAGDRMGVLTVISLTNRRAFGEEEATLLTLFAEPAALAIAHARLVEEREARAGELAARAEHLAQLQQASRGITSDLELGSLLSSLLEAALRLTGSTSARIWLPKGASGGGLNRAAGLRARELEELPPFTPSVQTMFANKTPLLANYASESPHLDPERTRLLGTGHLMGAPLVVRDQVVGALLVLRTVDQPPYTDEEGALLASLADQAAVAVHKARLFADLVASEEQFRQLAETMRDMVSVIDTEGRYSYVNRRFSDLLGYSSEEMLGREPADFLTPTAVRVAHEHQSLVAQGQQSASTYEVDFVARDGSLVPVEVSLVTIERDGQPAGQQMVGRDLRPRREAQERLLRDEKLRAMGQLASGVAHDFNNALARIIGTLELLRLERRELPPWLEEQLRIIDQASRGEAETVRRLQEFTRGSEGLARMEPLEAHGLLDDVARLTQPRWQAVAQEQGVTIECLVACEPDLWLRGSPGELREALTNLVFNAVDAMSNGGRITLRGRRVQSPKPKVQSQEAEVRSPKSKTQSEDGGGGPWTLGVGLGTDAVELAVIDTGLGMSEEVRQRALEPFFSTKGERGSGLGLSMVYGIAVRHGGEVWVETAEGQGTTMALILPATEVQGPKPKVQSLAGTAVGNLELPREPGTLNLERPRSGLRVLVVDDERVLAHVLSELLRKEGHQVEEATSGKEALRLVRQAVPDVVFTDIGMPRMSGWKLARLIARLRPRPGLVAVTGWGHGLNEAEVAAGGFDALVAKPYGLREIRAALEQAIRSHHRVGAGGTRPARARLGVDSKS